MKKHLVSAKEAARALLRLAEATRACDNEIDQLNIQLEQDRKLFRRWLPVAVLFGLASISLSFYLASN